jgi:aryl-alcohol dehydrogenase-like predicted oxidoreductase
MAYQGPSVYSPFFSLVKLERPWYYRIPPFNDDDLPWFEEHQDVTIAAWSAQGRGFFGGYPQYDPEKADALTKMAVLTPTNFARKERVLALSEKTGIKPSQISLLYVLSQKANVSAVIGPRSNADLDKIVAACEHRLTQEQIDFLTLKRDTLD